jgi:hypothetical protein
VTAKEMLLLLLLLLLSTLTSMLVPPFSFTSSSCAFCITARNYETNESGRY